MNRFSWREVALALLVVLSFNLPAFAQDKPVDETSGAPFNEEAEAGAPEQDKPTLRLQWQREAWGVTTTAFRNLVLQQGKIHTNKKKNVDGPRWVNIGPADADYEQNGSFTGHVRDSGRARTILPHPTDPELVYFLTSGGGLWKTKNWSAQSPTWEVLTDDLPTTGGGSVAFGKDPNHLYLGLGDFVDQVLVGGSVAKSKNGGNTWSAPVELGTAISVRDIKVDTSTTKDIVLVATESGLYRSTDEGASYSAIATFNGLSVWTIVRTSAGWLASAQPCNPASVGLQCTFATTLYLSTDKGATWAPISNAGNVFSANGRTTLGVAVPGDSVVYAYSSNVGDTVMRDVYRSADGGQTWVANGVNSTKVPLNPNPSQPNMNICTGQCWYNQSIAVDPADPSRNTVWIGGTLAAAVSTNGGSSWTLKTWWLYSQFPTLPYAHADHHHAVIKTTGAHEVVLGNDGGLNTSLDNGTTFSSDKNRGLQTFLFYGITGNKDLPNLVLGGTQDNGTRLRTDNGLTYNQVIGGDGMGAAYSQGNTNTSMGSSQGSGIRTNFSNNPPTVFQNWVPRGALADSAGALFHTPVIPAPAALDATGKVFFHITASRVWRTNDGGLTFIMIGSATPPTSPGLPPTRRFRSSVHNISVSPTDLNRVAVGAGGGFVDITTNGGASWTDVNLIALVPGYQGFVTGMTWQNDTTLWVAAAAQAAGAVRVIKGTVATPATPWSLATWTPMQNGLPDLPVTRVYIDPKDGTGNTVLAATHVGLYRTTDGGANWAPYGTGLPNVRVSDIYMPPDGSVTRISTYGRGIWELSQLELADATLSDDVTSCDSDGVVDNGETGNLTITLANQGPNNVNDVTITVTTTNPNVSFPNGNVLNFPPVQKNDTSTGSINVSVNGAAGIGVADFKLSISSSDLGVPPFNVVSSHRVNYDEVANGSATETFESASPNWGVFGDPTNMPNILAFQRRKLSTTNHVFWGPDNNGQEDDTKPSLPDEQYVVSPVMNVGAGPLTISFTHRFAFESGNWDGGVVELSTNGGATWVDIGTGTYNGTTNSVTTAPIGTLRPAYINRNLGWPNFINTNLNLGTAFAGQNVIIRFRIGADESTGAPGWDIDNVAVSGITNTPFTALVGETSSCP